MAYAKRTKNENGVTTRKAPGRAPTAARGKALEAKPEALSREAFERLHDDVARRIPKTLSILAK